MCYAMPRREPVDTPGGLEEGPLLPEGSGDAESPAWLLKQLAAYHAGLVAAYADPLVGARKVRRAFREYTIKNCEESYGGGGG